MLNEGESDLNEYLDDPTNPVVCVPEQDRQDGLCSEVLGWISRY